MKKDIIINCDVDGVLIKTFAQDGSYQWVTHVEKDLGITVKQVHYIFSNEWNDVLCGYIDMKIYVEAMFQRLHITTVSTDEFIMYWLNHNATVNEEVMALCQTLRSQGIPVFLITNQERYRTQYLWDTLQWSQLFDGIFSSFKLGCKKPQEAFFCAVEKQLKVVPSNLLLIDDLEENIKSANHCGWHTHHYRNSVLLHDCIDSL